MGKLIKPSNYALEKWMRVRIDDKRDLVMFSGIARFGFSPHDTDDVLVGTGESDSKEQLTWVDYDITEMIVGPHWRGVEQACPSVVPASHDQHAPDEADAMGFWVHPVTKAKLSGVLGDQRIELQLQCAVRGGYDVDNEEMSVTAYGWIPTLAYRVSVLGNLLPDPGDEGVFWGHPDF